MGLGDLSPEGSIVLGVFVGLASTSIQSLGLTLQRKSHMLEEERETQDARRPPYRRRRWQLGMLMFVISNIVGSTIQITTLPLPVLSTLQASGLVFNSLCATLILGEPFTRYSLAGTILVCAGALLIAIFGAISEPAHNLRELLLLLGRAQFIGWMIGQAALVLTILLLARISKIINPYNKNTPRMLLLRGMAYGAVSGILSAHSLLVAKSAVELIVKSIVDRDNQFNRWQSWVILLWLLALALSQLYYLHRGLKLCSTSVLYPFVFCVYNIIAILDGLIYFDQTSLLSVLDGGLIALGTAILLSGVICLSWRLQQDRDTPPTPLPQSTLTPGLGFVASDEASSPSVTSFSDEESGPLLPARSKTLSDVPKSHASHSPVTYGTTGSPGEAPESLQQQTPGKRTVHYAPGTHATSPRTPSPRLSRHKRALHTAGEIWDELEEDSPPIPFTRRHSLGLQSKAGLAPSRIRAATSAGQQASGSGPGWASMDSSGELPPIEEGLIRRDTGRSYRERSRGWRTRRESRGEERQGALGGWWRMRRWWRSRSRESSVGKGKDRAERMDDDGEDGGGGGGSSGAGGSGEGNEQSRAE